MSSRWEKEKVRPASSGEVVRWWDLVVEREERPDGPSEETRGDPTERG